MNTATIKHQESKKGHADIIEEADDEEEAIELFALGKDSSENTYGIIDYNNKGSAVHHEDHSLI